MGRIQNMGALAVFCLITMISCKHDSLVPEETGNGDGNGNQDPGICDEDTAYFRNQVLPIFISNCAMSGCHDAQTAEEGIILDSYDHVMDSEVIDPFDAGDSEAYEVITESDLDDRMPPPPASQLSSEQITLIRTWIEQGAKDNNCVSASCDSTAITYSEHILPIIQNNCLGCHSGTVASGGLNFSNHSGLADVASDGRLLGSINQDAGFVAMPQGGKLSDCEINQLTLWVEEGALNN